MMEAAFPLTMASDNRCLRYCASFIFPVLRLIFLPSSLMNVSVSFPLTPADPGVWVVWIHLADPGVWAELLIAVLLKVSDTVASQHRLLPCW